MPEPDRTLIHPGLAELYRRKVAALHEALEEDAIKDEAIELIRSLIEAVMLTPRHNQLQVEVRGELAAILAWRRAGNLAARTGIPPSKSRWLRGEDLNL